MITLPPTCRIGRRGKGPERIPVQPSLPQLQGSGAASKPQKNATESRDSTSCASCSSQARFSLCCHAAGRWVPFPLSTHNEKHVNNVHARYGRDKIATHLSKGTKRLRQEGAAAGVLLLFRSSRTLARSQSAAIPPSPVEREIGCTVNRKDHIQTQQKERAPGDGGSTWRLKMMQVEDLAVSMLSHPAQLPLPIAWSGSVSCLHLHIFLIINSQLFLVPGSCADLIN